MRALTVLLAAVLLSGCVSVRNDHALVPPSGLLSDFRAPLTVPQGPVPCDGLKVGHGSRSVYFKEWIWSGLSAEVCEMTLRDAIAEAGITKLYFSDYEQYSFLGFVTTFKVTAYGE